MPRQPKRFAAALATIFSTNTELRALLRQTLLDEGFAAPSNRAEPLEAAIYAACSRNEEMPALLLSALYAQEARHLAAELGLGRPTTGRAAVLILLTHFGFPALDDAEEETVEADDDSDDESTVRQTHRAAKEAFLAEVALNDERVARTLMPHQAQALREATELTKRPEAVLVSIATGGGKTMVGNEFVRDWLANDRGAVLWVTKDWDLLFQAFADASQRGITSAETARRIGGRSKALRFLEEASGTRATGITYTTLASLLSRTSGQSRLRTLPGRPTLVVWDECHWADSAASSDLIRKLAASGHITLLGLTGTPKATTLDIFKPTTPWSYRTLADRGVLARLKEVISIPTGVTWTPTAGASSGDFSLESIAQLGGIKPRNSLIVDTYCADPASFGKTLLFACSIEQANALCKAFSRRGASAVAFHAGLSEADNQLALARFRSGSAQLLVNVAKFTHGVDVPDIETLFLCRPTMSDVLFAQMVGRAVRKAPGKDSFRIVEFTDNVARFAGNLHAAEQYFSGAGSGGATTPRPRSATARERAQRYDHTGTLLWLPNEPSIPEALRGLPFRHGQTFGIEFELTTRDGVIPDAQSAAWMIRAEALRRALAKALPGRVCPVVTPEYQGANGDKDVSVWNVERDSTCGWEVTSPVLQGERGMLEVWTACQALEATAAELGLEVNWNTGTHIHLGWLGEQHGAEIVRALRIARLVEPVLATLVAPSRIAASRTGGYDIDLPNGYCRPVASIFPESFLGSSPTTEEILARADSADGRYLTVNVRPLSSIGTVEVRMHSGTLDAAKILAWVGLWMELLFVAGNSNTAIPLVEDRTVIRPSLQLVPLLASLLPNAKTPMQQAFLRRLEARSNAMVARWSTVPTLAPWLA
jgi:superfamily II DNA or RNA helicase